MLLCDRTRLYQVFSNLVGNAIDHMGSVQQPRISVAIESAGDFHRISVRDNGQGIAAEDHQRIFEVFQTLGRRPDSGGNSGIGLAIVKKIAEMRGGRTWVESEVGVGTAFHVELAVRAS